MEDEGERVGCGRGRLEEVRRWFVWWCGVIGGVPFRTVCVGKYYHVLILKDYAKLCCFHY